MKKKSKIVRSSALSLKFLNTGKREEIDKFLTEYKRVTEFFIEKFWIARKQGDKIKRMPNKEATGRVETWLSARAKQCAAKQASGIVSSCLAKNERREYQAQIFEDTGEFKKARKLREIIEEKKSSMPHLDNLEAQLDSRFFSFNESENSFDFWIILSSTGRKKLKIPLNSHKHFNKMLGDGERLNSIRLSRNATTFSFSFKSPENRGSETLGIDVGQNAVLSTSRGEQFVETNGWTLSKINERMARRRKGSKGFRRAATLRKNFVGASVNRLNFSDISTLKVEKIHNLKRGRKTTRKLSHWSYRELFTALESKSLRFGVRIEKVNPAFTSQRCSNCGWVRKKNRNGEQFKCTSCSYAANADLNAAVNISLNLEALPQAAYVSKLNRNGFFWNATHEPIVRVAIEEDFSIKI